MAVENREFQNSTERIIPYGSYLEESCEDDDDQEPEFSTYFSDDKVEIPSDSDDDDNVRCLLSVLGNLVFHMKWKMYVQVVNWMFRKRNIQGL